METINVVCWIILVFIFCVWIGMIWSEGGLGDVVSGFFGTWIFVPAALTGITFLLYHTVGWNGVVSFTDWACGIRYGWAAFFALFKIYAIGWGLYVIISGR